MSITKQPPKWITREEARQHLGGIAMSTLDVYINRGWIKQRKIGGTCLIDRNQIDDYLMRNER